MFNLVFHKIYVAFDLKTRIKNHASRHLTMFFLLNKLLLILYSAVRNKIYFKTMVQFH